MATKKEPVIEPVPEIDPLEDRIIVNIPPPNEEAEYEDEGLYVSVNGYNAYIKYGEDVEVPRFVKDMLDNRKLAQAEARKNARKYASKEKE